MPKTKRNFRHGLFHYKLFFSFWCIFPAQWTYLVGTGCINKIHRAILGIVFRRGLEKMTEKSAFFYVLEKNNEKIKKSYYKVFTKCFDCVILWLQIRKTFVTR